MLIEDIVPEGTRCWKGYKKHGMKTMFGKRVPDCRKNESIYENDMFSDVDIEVLQRLRQIQTAVLGRVSAEQWTLMVKDELEKAGYVWNKSQKKFVKQENVDEDLRKWFGKGKKGGAGGGGWDRYNTKGERIGKCGDSKKGEGKPKCLSKSRAASLRAKGGKKAIAAAVRKKRREDPNKNRKGKAKNVSNTTKKS